MPSVDKQMLSPSTFSSQRSRKQLSIFFAGASFFAISTLLTRRSLKRRYASTVPHFYQPSYQRPANPINGPFEALAALHLATFNVTSFALMMGGGLLWAFDISSLNDMRRRIKGGKSRDASKKTETDMEEEKQLEEWVASMLSKKGDK